MIRSVRVVGFRSLADCAFSLQGDVGAIVGRNGSGKSNALRALNLFFNGAVEEAADLDLRRDFHRPAGGRSRRRQEIRVEVELELPTAFNFRKSLMGTAGALELQPPKWTAPDARLIKIAKMWRRDPATESTASTAERWSPTSQDWVAVSTGELPFIDTLLQRLIRFRYVANHVHPLELIRREREELQHRLVVRMNRRRASTPQANPFESFNEIAGELMVDITTQIGSITTELAGAQVATPADWADIALSLDLELQTPGTEPRAAQLHGSGHQSLLALCLLHLIDTEYSASYGWRQATIWAIEEPESFLHHELAHGVARLLATFAENERFSVLYSTHSPIFMAYAESGVSFDSHGTQDLDGGSSLVESAMRSGASPFVHPLLAGAPRPLLVVEGDHDVTHIRQAYRRHNRALPFEIREASDFATTGGTGGLKKLIKEQRHAIAARPTDSPVVLLFDHDESQAAVGAAMSSLQQLHARSTAIRLDDGWLNPDLDPSPACFAGIEALLGTDFIEAAGAKAPEALLKPQGGTPISLKKDTQSAFKKAAAELSDTVVSAGDYERFEPLLDALEATLI